MTSTHILLGRIRSGPVVQQCQTSSSKSTATKILQCSCATIGLSCLIQNSSLSFYDGAEQVSEEQGICAKRTSERWEDVKRSHLTEKPPPPVDMNQLMMEMVIGGPAEKAEFNPKTNAMDSSSSVELEKISEFLKVTLRDTEREKSLMKIASKKIAAYGRRIKDADKKIKKTRNRRQRGYARMLKGFQKRRDYIAKDLEKLENKGILSDEAKELISVCEGGMLFKVNNAWDVVLDQSAFIPLGTPFLLIDTSSAAANNQPPKITLSMAVLFNSGTDPKTHLPITKLARPALTVNLPADTFKMVRGSPWIVDDKTLLKMDASNAQVLIDRVNELNQMKMFSSNKGVNLHEMMMKSMGSSFSSNGSAELAMKRAFASDRKTFLKARMSKQGFSMEDMMEDMMKDNMKKQVIKNPEMKKMYQMMNAMGMSIFDTTAQCLLEVYIDGEIELLVKYAKSKKDDVFSCLKYPDGARASGNVVYHPSVGVPSMFNGKYPAVIITDSNAVSKSLLTAMESKAASQNLFRVSGNKMAVNNFGGYDPF